MDKVPGLRGLYFYIFFVVFCHEGAKPDGLLCFGVPITSRHKYAAPMGLCPGLDTCRANDMPPRWGFVYVLIHSGLTICCPDGAMTREAIRVLTDRLKRPEPTEKNLPGRYRCAAQTGKGADPGTQVCTFKSLFYLFTGLSGKNSEIIDLICDFY